MRKRRWLPLSTQVYIYRNRLRVHAVQELLAVMGVAIAVALVFAVTVGNNSIAGSTEAAVHILIGPASLQLEARSNDGFNEDLLQRVQRLPGVRRAAPLLEQDATITGANGRHETVGLAGTDISLALLDGLAETLPISTLAPADIALSTVIAEALRIKPSDSRSSKVSVSVNLRGTSHRLKVAAVLGTEAVGALSRAFVATMPLASLQRIAGLQRRITRVLVQVDPGREAQVRGELQHLARDRLEVAPADQDIALLHQALRPGDQASEFFAIVAGLLGFLFAFNALLLTVPERRRVIADLRMNGATRSAIVQMVIFQATCLGIAASLVGLLSGYALSLGAFHTSAGYLNQAFLLSSATVIGWSPIALSLLGGILASCLASTIPLLDLRPGRALDAVYSEDDGNRLGSRVTRRLAFTAGALLLISSVLFALTPALALVACGLLAFAVVLATPLIFASMLRTIETLTKRYQRLTLLPVALLSLKATTLRSLALISTGALALFGSVALGGARGDLLRGIEGYIDHYVAGADIWVVNQDDPTAVEPLPLAYVEHLKHSAATSNIQVFQAGYLAFGKRLIWVVARPPGALESLLQSQIVEGQANTAAAHIDAGGWIAISQQIAEERHIRVGNMLSVPTPTGNKLYRIAATTTNLTWSPGAMLMSTTDYSQAWGSQAPTAIAIDFPQYRSPAMMRRIIAEAIGPTSALETLTPKVRATKTSAVAREGLSKLNDISLMLLLAAIGAIFAALTSAIWQRRASLAELRLGGVRSSRLRRLLFIEAVLMLTTACASGAIAGLYGQAVIDRYLKHVTGFPVASFYASWRPLWIAVLVSTVVLMIVIIPGWLASRVPPTFALEE
jgi:putative ABC transport system permease protein